MKEGRRGGAGEGHGVDKPRQGVAPERSATPRLRSPGGRGREQHEDVQGLQVRMGSDRSPWSQQVVA
jgi:hypothetical protein